MVGDGSSKTNCTRSKASRRVGSGTMRGRLLGSPERMRSSGGGSLRRSMRAGGSLSIRGNLQLLERRLRGSTMGSGLRLMS
jgi:hypothetical protein